MKIIIILFLALTVVQAIFPKKVLISEDKLYPKKTLKEWQKILENIEYYPSNAPKTKGIPQPALSGKAISPRIIGGDNAVNGQFPWQVAIYMDDSYFCGGSLISGIWVLTAGHCVADFTSFNVYAGTLSPGTGGQQQTSKNKILHSGFNPYYLQNDIGLIRFTKAFNIGTTNINSILLPSKSLGDLVGATARVSGWGKTSDTSELSPVLKYVDLVIINSTTCADYYGTFSSAQICSSTVNKRSPCNGDVGGPLSIVATDNRWTQVGIISFGSKNGCEVESPVGFTRLTSYLEWISSNTGLSL